MTRVAVAIVLMCGLANAVEPRLSFERQRIGDTVFEACSVFDVDNDGHLDIVTGGVWYPGPDFTEKVKICDVDYVSEYYDDFADYPLDVNGDGYLDIVTGGWFGKTLRWRENPQGRREEWTIHDIGEVGNIERGCFWDLNGDGFVEAVPNLPGNPFVVFQLVRDEQGRGTGKFNRYDISPLKQGHGLGHGDINGNGRGDLITANGWLECPEDPFTGEWTWHPEFDFGGASVPILVHDMNADGMNDLIVGQGHDYGLARYEQGRDADGNRTWTKHDIETNLSQFHDMHLADLTKDGRPELITGKRWRAHNGNDPGGNEPVGLYYYLLNDGQPQKMTIDFGEASQHSGTGIYLWATDINGNGWTDIVAPGKEGLYLFRNQGWVTP